MITIVQSIRPRWTKDIFSLKKRIELRKDKPATDEPFRVLIYETKGGITKESRHLPFPQHEGAGAVVGEYLCAKTFKFSAEFTEPANALGECHEDIRHYWHDEESDEDCSRTIATNGDDNPDACWLCEESCLSFTDIKKYIGVNAHDKKFYGYWIKDLIKYEKPIPITAVKKRCICPEMPYCPSCPVGYEYMSESEAEFFRMGESATTEWCCLNHMKRAPQDWCYADEGFDYNKTIKEMARR